MAHILYEIDEQSTLVVETEDSFSGDIAAGAAMARAASTFDAALSKLNPIVSSLSTAISALPSKPDEVSIEFGVKFDVGADLILAKSTGGANLQLKLCWKSK